MIDENQLWQMVQDNHKHIATLNREMGGVLSSINWIRIFIGAQVTIACGTFLAVMKNLHLTKQNGNGQKTLRK